MAFISVIAQYLVYKLEIAPVFLEYSKHIVVLQK